MRFLYLALSFLYFGISVNAQKVPSSCETQDSILYWYKRDAAYLCLYQFERQGSSYTDSIQFPSAVYNKKLGALIAVYNATIIPESDTVTRLLRIHEFPNLATNEFVIYADSNLNWMQSFRNNQFPTGFQELDSLLILYDFSLIRYYDFSGFGQHWVTLETSQILNIYALSKEFDKIGIDGSPNVGGFDGDRIVDSVYSDHIELIFSKGWGDCPSGCLKRRFWKFNVYDDCSVEFVESYGNTLPPATGMLQVEAQKTKIYPVPFMDRIHIEGIDDAQTFEIYGMDGRLVQSGTIEQNQIPGLINIPTGIYLLKVDGFDSQNIFKIVK